MQAQSNFSKNLRGRLISALVALVVTGCFFVISPNGCFVVELDDITESGWKAAVTELSSGRTSISCFDDIFSAFPSSAIFGPADSIAPVHNGTLTRDVFGDPMAEEEPQPGQGSTGTPLYVVHAFTNSVSVVNSETSARLANITVGTDPRWIDVSADQSKAFVTNRGSDSITVIDTMTMTIDTTIELLEGSAPLGVAPGPNGDHLYVINTGLSSVSKIELSSGQVVATSPAGEGAIHTAVSPDGQLVYVTNQTAGTVSVFDALTMEPVRTIEDLAGATSVIFEGRGRRAFVTGIAGSQNGQLFVIQTSDHTRTGSIRVGMLPVSVRMSPHGSLLMVTNQASGSISVIDPDSETVTATVRVGAVPSDTAVVL